MWAGLASILMAVPVLGIELFVVPTLILRWHRIAVLLMQVLAGGIVYLGVISISKITEVEELKQQLRQNFIR